MRTAEQNKRAQIAYDTAYFVLPRYAQSDIAGFRSEFEESPDLRAMFYFTLAAKMRGGEPDIEDLRQLRCHTGRFDTGQHYIVIEYPRFPAIDLLSGGDGGLPEGIGSYILAPYFSAIIDDRDAGEPRCFVLGQSPDARTTLRAVTPMMNASLGPGCEPELAAFLALLRRMAFRSSGLSR
jgi:hypothetical protein